MLYLHSIAYVAALFALNPATVFAQSKDRATEVILAIEIPVPTEKFLYRVTGTVAGVEYYPSKVPLISFENSEKWMRQVGEIDVGSEFKIDKISSFKGRHFFGVEQKVNQGGKEIITIVWLDGMFLEVSGPNASFKSTVAK